MGFAVKLDTNGFHPQALAEILERGLVDYVAMDIKNRREKYGDTCGVPGLDPAPVKESLHLLIGSGVDFELRTTLVRNFHTPEDLAAMGRWVAGFFPEGTTPRYFLQKFVDSGNLISTGCGGFDDREMAAMAEKIPVLPSPGGAAGRGMTQTIFGDSHESNHKILWFRPLTFLQHVVQLVAWGQWPHQRVNLEKAGSPSCIKL